MEQSNSWLNLIKIGVFSSIISYSVPGWCQIVPDRSLGTESSIVTPENVTSDRIEGGAMRGSNLFHSFQEFSINEGHSASFANPVQIQNIFSRVTGHNISNILGTLGVEGAANLFLINPNGIIFGQNAQLNIAGSFVASTANNLVFNNGLQFSATNPEAVPLLNINLTPGLQLGQPQGDIVNSGNLLVGQNLTLNAQNLNLSGTLTAGNNLTLQALNPIITNASFSSGGNFQIQDLNGNPGNVKSPGDPVIRASGDVSFSTYTGASLHIFAGGSVTIDNINITGADPNDPIQETLNLSDGVTQVTIDGSSKPTLDIRAGTTNFNPTGTIGSVDGLSAVPNLYSEGTSADITINQITNTGGFVFLSNQNQPNTALLGNIKVDSIDLSSSENGGSVVIDSKGSINVEQVINTFGDAGNGGDVKLLATGDILLPVTAQIVADSNQSIGGNIAIKSQSAINATKVESLTFVEGGGGNLELAAPTIILGDRNLTEPPEDVGTNLVAATGTGNVQIQANYLELNGVQLAVATFSADKSGNLSINADSILLKMGSQIGAIGLSAVGGDTGDINIQTNDLTLTDGSQINSQIFTGSIGNSGKININAQNSINLLGTFGGTPSAIVTDIFDGAEGNGGAIAIKTNSLTLRDGGQVRASTNGNGNAGTIAINTKNLNLDGATLVTSEPLALLAKPILIPSAVLSEVRPTAVGNGNTIDITTENLKVTNGGFISASTEGQGNAGNINILATKSISFDGLFNNENLAQPQPSGAFVGVLQGALGQGGILTINTPVLSVTNGAQLEALTEDSGNAGNIEIFATDSVLLSGTNTGLFSNTTATATGNAGNIFIDPDLITIRDGAAISVDSHGTGTGGNITLLANKLILDNQAKISATTASTNGGNITLDINDLILLRDQSKISTDAGTAEAGGDGGNIQLTTDLLVAFPQENSDITANAFLGRGGNIGITAKSLFGIEFREQLTPLSDITASSEFGVSGIVVISNPDVDPSSGLVTLPKNVSDPSDRIVKGCAAAQGNSFTVTGRGGLPPDPTATIRGQTLLSDLRDFADDQSVNDQAKNSNQVSENVPHSIQQATNWYRNEQGQIELVANLSQEIEFQKYPNCQTLHR